MPRFSGLCFMAAFRLQFNINQVNTLNMKLVNKTSNGQIVFCPDCKVFHLEFGNLFLTLTPRELQSFYKYVCSIDYKYYRNHNKDAFNNRKLLLEVGCNRVKFCLYASELFELKNLLSGKNNTWYLIPGKLYFDNILIFN